MLKARFAPYTLEFKQKAVTSRNVMSHKDTYIVQVWDTTDETHNGTGEIALFKGLSKEDDQCFEERLRKTLKDVDNIDLSRLSDSSIIFGLETALSNLRHGGSDIVFPSAFTEGGKDVCINGLVWMGDFNEMLTRIDSKIREGFRCIKLKVGGIDIESEIRLIEYIRKKHPAGKLVIRLDANCSFSRYTYTEAADLLMRIASYGIHSIEQPFAVSDVESTRRICAENIIPVALDEQLIGVTSETEKRNLLEYLKPQYIILKPSLCGGFSHSSQWIEKAAERGIGWWVTSALESAIGLNAIAQWTAGRVDEAPQGLGTGELYKNDFPTPLRRRGEWLSFNTRQQAFRLPDTIDWVYV